MVNKSIAIDARPLAGGYSGYTTYLISIIEPLLGAGFDVMLVSNRPLNPAHAVIQRCQVEVFGSVRSSVWEQIDVPRFLEHKHFDIYLVGTNKGLPWRKARDTRYVLALLDVIPYLFPRYYMTKLHYIVRELRPVSQLTSVMRADEIVTISAQSAVDIRKLFRRPATALLMKLGLKPLSELVGPEPVIAKPQFSYVGGVDKRKKIDVLLRAFAAFKQKHTDYRLVLIGRGYEAFNDLADELGVRDSVTMTGFVDEPTKMRYIAESTALVYPSLYEGYGLAIAEGFMAGVPVIAGPGGSQAEVGGKGVLYVDPTSSEQVTAAMERILEPEMRRELAAARAEQMKVLFGPQVEQHIVNYFMRQAELAQGKRA